MISIFTLIKYKYRMDLWRRKFNNEFYNCPTLRFIILLSKTKLTLENLKGEFECSHELLGAKVEKKWCSILSSNSSWTPLSYYNKRCERVKKREYSASFRNILCFHKSCYKSNFMTLFVHYFSRRFYLNFTLLHLTFQVENVYIFEKVKS